MTQSALRSGFVDLFFFSSRRRHTRLVSDWSSDVCSSDLAPRVSSRSAASRMWSDPLTGSASSRTLNESSWLTNAMPTRIQYLRRSEERRGRERGEISGGGGALERKEG